MIVRRIPIRNVASSDVAVHVEPWGEQHVLAAEECLDLVFCGPAGGKPEVHVGMSELFVYGWQQSSVFVLKNNLCLSQPSLLEIIEEVARYERVVKSRLELEPDVLEHAQCQLDIAESWDAAGREAAFAAVSKVAPWFRALRHDRFIWAFCETVLQSRGVFLQSDEGKYKEFLDAYYDSGDFMGVLLKWHQASLVDPELIDAGTGH